MTDLVSIFCEVDDFCKYFFKFCKFLSSGRPTKRDKPCSLQPSKIMTITLYYHHSGYSTFKDYYEKHVQQALRAKFTKLVTYNRFIELKKAILGPLLVLLITKKLSPCDGYSIIDSSKIARKGKTSIGWFFGPKVHIMITPIN